MEQAIRVLTGMGRYTSEPGVNYEGRSDVGTDVITMEGDDETVCADLDDDDGGIEDVEMNTMSGLTQKIYDMMLVPEPDVAAIVKFIDETVESDDNWPKVRMNMCNLFNEKDLSSRTLVHVAAQRNQRLIMRRLIPLMASLVNFVRTETEPSVEYENMVDTDGNTPLHLAVKAGHYELAEDIVKLPEMRNVGECWVDTVNAAGRNCLLELQNLASQC